MSEARLRVAVVGTGATAVQCIPHLAANSKQLYVFQRTPASVDVRGNRPTDSEWAKSLETGWVTNRQIEAARIAMTRKIRRGGKVWINVFPDKPVTKKPAETRMGSGKGSPEGWVAVVKPGRVMFELSGVDETLAREAMRLAGHKLPVKTKFVMREDGQ